jgi:NUMOD4 motif
MEIWKPIAGYEGIYEVSDQGRIKRVAPADNSYPGKILAGGLDKDGYRILLLYKNGKRKTFKAHRLVAEHFVPNPNNLPQVNHQNAVKTDNSANNLEWCSCQHNISHAVSKGLWNAAKGANHGNSKLAEDQVIEIRCQLSRGVSCETLGQLFGVSPSTVHDIFKRRTWAWLN